MSCISRISTSDGATGRAARSIPHLAITLFVQLGLLLAMVLASEPAPAAAVYTANAYGCKNEFKTAEASPQFAATVQASCTASWFYGNAAAKASEFGLGVSADGVHFCCGSYAEFRGFAQVVTQFIISGPAGSGPIDTSLNLDFVANFGSGTFTDGTSSRQARIDLLMSAAGFGTVGGRYFGLYHDLVAGGVRTFSYSGTLAQAPGVIVNGDGYSSIDGTSVTPVFRVPVNTPVDITLSLDGTVLQYGNASGAVYAMDTLYFPLDGPVFNLPDGYSATILGLNVENNRVVRDDVGTVPEPGTLALFSLGLAGLATARRRGQSSATPDECTASGWPFAGADGRL